MHDAEPEGPRRLTSLQLAAYAAPSLGFGLAVVPVVGVLPTLYAQHASVSVTAIGTLVLLRSIYNAVSDQVIGYLSDRTQTALGARLPWIIAGAALTLVSMLYLFRIPPDAGLGYFAVWTIVFFTGSTMFEIPHYAWGHELSTYYDERSRIFGFKGFADNAGSLLFSALPILLVFVGVLPSSEYTPHAVWTLGMIVIALLPVLVGLAATFAPRGPARIGPRTTLLGVVRSLRGNRPFQRFIAAYLLAGTGYGFFVALLFPFVSTYLEIPDAFATILLVTTLTGLASVPIWIRVTAVLGKHRAWAWGWLLNSLVLVPIVWVEPGPGAVLPTCVLMAAYALTNGVSSIAPFAILSDVIDYDILKTGVDRGGNYYGLMMLAVKALASTGGIALIVLGSVFGYQMTAGAQNSPSADLGMLAMFVGAPALFQLATLPLIWNFPIDARRHDIIRRRLDRRHARVVSG
jgi:Na+/melibiose symporter-like transporter